MLPFHMTTVGWFPCVLLSPQTLGSVNILGQCVALYSCLFEMPWKSRSIYVGCCFSDVIFLNIDTNNHCPYICKVVPENNISLDVLSTSKSLNTADRKYIHSSKVSKWTEIWSWHHCPLDNFYHVKSPWSRWKVFTVATTRLRVSSHATI